MSEQIDRIPIEEISHRRKYSGWRKSAREELDGISPELAKGFLANSSDLESVRGGAAALDALDDEARRRIWQSVFPGIAEVVDLTWQHLDAQTIARRDGGLEGHGEPFTWKLSDAEASYHRFTWLRKLAIVAGPFPELDFIGILHNIAVATGQMEEHEGAFFSESSGHMYDSDTLGYAASVLLEHSAGSPLATQVEDILEAQILGKLPGAGNRHSLTAIMCAERPDLWAKLDGYLADAGREPGFRDQMLRSRLGGRPGAWLHLLQTIRDHELLRFESVRYQVRWWFAVDWRWPKFDRDSLEPWLARWVEVQESSAAREEAFSADEAGEFALALWAEAVRDGDAALARIADPDALGTRQRVGAAQFLAACRGKRRAVTVVRYATHEDLGAAAVALPLLTGEDSALPTAAEMPDLFERLHACVESLPAKPKVPPAPAPFATPKADFSPLLECLAREFPDGAENLIEAVLPRMRTEVKTWVVDRLDRYRTKEEELGFARIIYSDDPEGMADWLTDHDGEQTAAQRLLILKLTNDKSAEVSAKAMGAVKEFTLTAEELEVLRPVLASRSEKKRLGATQLLASQPLETATALVRTLLASRKAAERLAALEVLRSLHDTKETAAAAGEIWRTLDYQPATKGEEQVFATLAKALGAAEERAPKSGPPSTRNAFGLVDPKAIAPPVAPREHDVLLHSPVTVRLLHAMKEWLEARADLGIPQYNGETQRLADCGVPSVSSGSREEKLKRFPAAEELATWWGERPDELRDPDGHELFRLRVLLREGILEREAKSPQILGILFGLDRGIALEHRMKLSIGYAIGWIEELVPGRPEGYRGFLIDATETAWVRLPERQKHRCHPWSELVTSHTIRDDDCPRADLERLWKLGRNHREAAAGVFHFPVYELIKFVTHGIATREELIWQLVGGRDLKDGRHAATAFRDYGWATTPPGSYAKQDLDTIWRPVVGEITGRIIDLELTRGEAPEEWSYAAAAIQQVSGARHLQRLLAALGKTKLTRKRRPGYGEIDVARSSVLIHLIGTCVPAGDDTPESFAALMQEAGISTERLLEIALLRPVWARHIECATGIPSLREAVAWIFAHTRSGDWQWQSYSQDLWAGDLSYLTPIPAEDFLAGAVDPEWFARVYQAVGAKTWNVLYSAAKFASTGRGHTRARLYADAILDRTPVAALEKMLVGKGNLDAALAIGLPPLPEAGKKRDDELLQRYEILQDLRRRSRKSKAQRRASEERAYETGVQNLARRAGFSDTLRFEWSMETRASADLAAGALHTTVEDVEAAIEVTPAGKLKLQVRRGDKSLANVPAKLRKHPDIVALRERMDGLKNQAQRLRPALEDLMVRGVALSSAEWRELLKHPLAGPLVSRLVLAGGDKLLGFPGADGFDAPHGMATPWPAASQELCLAHPCDFLPAADWHSWQRFVFERELVQPFKQVFRELYLPTDKESAEKGTTVHRYRGQVVTTRNALALLSQRHWVFHPEDGLHRIFRAEGITAWIGFEEYFHSPHECEEVTIDHLRCTDTKSGEAIPVATLPPRIFSEVMRDADLIVSVAHAGGADPESTPATIESRAALVRETCRLLNLENVQTGDKHAEITGALGKYRVHLGSGVVHRLPGTMIPVQSDPEAGRGRLFLPFADDDPLSAAILSKVLLFAHDDAIRDPALAKLLRA